MSQLDTLSLYSSCGAIPFPSISTLALSLASRVTLEAVLYLFPRPCLLLPASIRLVQYVLSFAELKLLSSVGGGRALAEPH